MMDGLLTLATRNFRSMKHLDIFAWFAPFWSDNLQFQLCRLGDRVGGLQSEVERA
jgi:hypothetical protein